MLEQGCQHEPLHVWIVGAFFHLRFIPNIDAEKVWEHHANTVPQWCHILYPTYQEYFQQVDDKVFWKCHNNDAEM